jgi:hypothetical protein
MLISCPECERQVSDRAVACPACGFPIAEHVAAEAARAARAEERSTREHVGEVDCVACEARGFRMVEPEGGGGQMFAWCVVCEHSGRVPLCRSTDGFFAVSWGTLDAFLRGEVDAGGDVRALGAERPKGHRYPQAGPRRSQAQPAMETARHDDEPEET